MSFSCLHRRPTKAQSSYPFSSLSFFFIAFLAVLCFCIPAVAQAEDAKSECGTVIGIGKCQ
ncbi:hypothetical protein M378DRAFT_167278 [Amanita muscaria Koide BX008]|uniref:Uncharacterized protein n=1 Tax=Amanita muscaria (strain Koide BX008) TaxID=946122 RepID=A0A0C2T3P0_AMAMK|nr:hypothetical protein M378DRAFT_167278 [Amanita muscaria Koide BX008]